MTLRGTNILMIYSSMGGNYKFPGGGVDEGESHEQALRREVQEECGMSLAKVGREIGSVVEYNLPIEKEYDAFRMISHYYQCDVQDGFGLQKLDGYEKDLGLCRSGSTLIRQLKPTGFCWIQNIRLNGCRERPSCCNISNRIYFNRSGANHVSISGVDLS